jgi:uncharacterized membrane protein YjjP (DUF1212 family)
MLFFGKSMSWFHDFLEKGDVLSLAIVFYFLFFIFGQVIEFKYKFFFPFLVSVIATFCRVDITIWNYENQSWTFFLEIKGEYASMIGF